MYKPQKFTDSQEACFAGVNYTYALLYDYESYILDFRHVITLDEFVQGWTMIRLEDFKSLVPGDIIYDDGGDKYEVVDIPIEDDDYVWSVKVKNRAGEYCHISSGCAWSEPYSHRDYEWRKKYNKEEDKPWPTLIISKKERQS